MNLRLMGTEAECARMTMLLRFGVLEGKPYEVLGVSQPYPNRGDSDQVRVYVEVQQHDVNPLVDRTFYSMIGPDGEPLLLDAWGNQVQHGDPDGQATS